MAGNIRADEFCTTVSVNEFRTTLNKMFPALRNDEFDVSMLVFQGNFCWPGDFNQMIIRPVQSVIRTKTNVAPE